MSSHRRSTSRSRVGVVASLLIAALGATRGAQSQGRSSPAVDATRAVPRACNDEALSMLAARHVLDRLDADALLASARAEGETAPSLHLVALPADGDEARERWLARLVERGLGPLRCGEAVDGEHRVVVAAPAQGSLRIDGEHVRVELAASFHDPVLYVRAAGDEPIAVAVVDGRAEVDVDALERPIVLQLVAAGSDGPRPVAELALVAAGAQAESPLPEDRSAIDVLRGARGRGALRTNRLLDQVAHEHAARVCREQHVAHELSGEGDVVARLHAARLEARHAGEVVARAVDDAGAWRALTRSASHRAALGDTRFTDVGIGRAEAHGHVCVVVELAAWPRRR